ncbi:MAG: hypothetical protein B7Y41_10525 [Hydrogenophilales bacterium 28-61-23]|nr:MAG: hypothetical protein B7Y41_10525 [Hydrogenophilales bacterium 28-61-23]
MKSDPLLDAKQAAFLGGPVAINVASHDAAQIPSIARAYGCRISADRREVVVFLSKRCAQAILRDLAAGAPVAAVFSRPKTHETLQIKGARGRIQPLQAGDRAIMRACGAAFSAEIMLLGYSASFSDALMAPANDDAVGVAFMPDAVFEQTPGPKAGMRLEPKP